MPQSNNPEAQLYDHTHQLLRAHEALLRDAVRNRAFYRALEKCVTSDSVVLDIGAGVGLWAIAAAKLGAKKVCAIEKDELLSGTLYISTHNPKRIMGGDVELILLKFKQTLKGQ